MDKEYLNTAITNQYDFVAVKNRVSEVFSLFDYLKLVDNKIELPKITASYNVVYSQRLKFISTSKVEDFVIKKLMLELRDNENSRQRLLTKITLALTMLTKLELKVFRAFVYEGKTLEEVSEEINSCVDNVRIYRKSAFTRFLIALGVDYDCYLK